MTNHRFLSDLTIVVPTRERHQFVQRLLDYYREFPLKILILDGSDNLEKSVEKKFLNWANIEYVHENTSYLDRVKNNIDRVKTKFVVLLSDDEFHLPNALDSCVQFLMDNEDYSTVGGICIGFSPTDTVDVDVLGFQKYKLFAGLDICDCDPAKRLIGHFTNYTPSHLYSVQRTSAWRQILEKCEDDLFDIFAFPELQIEAFSTVIGKTKILSEVMWLRSHNEVLPVREAYIGSEPGRSFADFWLFSSSKTKSELVSFFACRMPSSNAQQTNPIMHHHIQLAFDMYTKRALRNVGGFRIRLLRKVGGMVLPKMIQSYVREMVFGSSVVPANSKTLVDYCKDLESEGISVDWEDLKRVEDTVKSYHAR